MGCALWRGRLGLFFGYQRYDEQVYHRWMMFEEGGVTIGTVWGAFPACSRLGKWWCCPVYLLCVTCISTKHVTVLWYLESLFHLPPSLMEASSPPAVRKEKNLKGLKEGVPDSKEGSVEREWPSTELNLNSSNCDCWKLLLDLEKCLCMG